MRQNYANKRRESTRCATVVTLRLTAHCIQLEKHPIPAAGDPPQKSYTLRFDLYEGAEMPGSSTMQVVVNVGPFTATSQKQKSKVALLSSMLRC